MLTQTLEELGKVTFFAERTFPILKSNLDGSTALSGPAAAAP